MNKETGFVKNKSTGEVHQVMNYIDKRTIRLRYFSQPSKMKYFESATEQEYKDYVRKPILKIYLTDTP